MKYLLDTHVLIWFLNGDEKVNPKVRSIIQDESNTIFVSIASIWELAIKHSLGKISFPFSFGKFLQLIRENGFNILEISFEHTHKVTSLPFFHLDPFDRMLVAQAQADDLVFITVDEEILKYEINAIW